MNNYSQPKVGILCGGFSSEYDISLKSATTILQNFPEGYEPFLIYVTTEGWIANYKDINYDIQLSDLSFETPDGKIKPDLALIYIHGNPGENGKIQAYLDIINMPYINSNALASELSFDKWYCNQFLKGFGIAVAESVFLTKGETFEVDAIVKKLGLPLFVKPTDSGSSFGISKVKTVEELPKAIETAFAEGNTLVIEAFLDGKEVTCGVYNTSEGLHALPLTEIVTENDFFDYEAKYLGKSSEITPARVDESTKKEVQALAKRVYQLLNLRSIARIDCMVVQNKPYVIEVNTTPGFSPASIVPQMIKADGKTIKEFWSEILSVELKKMHLQVSK